MLPELTPVFRQLDETYEAVRISIESAGADRLGWTLGHDVPTFASIAEHIASANLTYASMIGPADVRRKWDLDPCPSKDWLLVQVDESLAIARQVLDGVTVEGLHESRCDDWQPNCEEQVIEGPLDAVWFAMQMVRHTAYHLGQLNLYLRVWAASAHSESP